MTEKSSELNNMHWIIHSSSIIVGPLYPEQCPVVHLIDQGSGHMVAVSGLFRQTEGRQYNLPRPRVDYRSN